jgi:hypothetical protein
MSTHPTPWLLQRLHAGEQDVPGAEAARLHAAGCEACRARLRAHDEAQARFEAAISFDRFAAGVERATQRTRSRAPAPLVRRLAPLAALAAVALLGVTLAPRLGDEVLRNRLKGAGAVELRIGGTDGTPQRVATPGEPEALLPGERVRLGYAAGAGDYVLAVSVDAAGAVSALYPEHGESLAVEGGEGMHYLPDSLEFTGAGLERVILVRSRTPLAVERVREAAAQAFAQARGDLARLGALDVEGEQTQWLLVKP